MGFALTKNLFSSLSFIAKSPICPDKDFYKTSTHIASVFSIDLALSLPKISWHPWRSWRWQ